MYVFNICDESEVLTFFLFVILVQWCCLCTQTDLLEYSATFESYGVQVVKCFSRK